jgi:hypothetical protein
MIANFQICEIHGSGPETELSYSPFDSARAKQQQTTTTSIGNE